MHAACLKCSSASMAMLLYHVHTNPASRRNCSACGHTEACTRSWCEYVLAAVGYRSCCRVLRMPFMRKVIDAWRQYALVLNNDTHA